MAASQPSIEEQLSQLESARRLVLQDPAYWPQVFHGTLPIIAGPIIEVRRWGADFLAQTFSTPIVDAKVKQELALPCLDTLLRLAGESEAGILKSVVQCSASVYPIIFRHMYVSRPAAVSAEVFPIPVPVPVPFPAPLAARVRAFFPRRRLAALPVCVDVLAETGDARRCPPAAFQMHQPR